jgi:molybdopterin-containing oxidoreductase family iron-sulfur binding subunit
MSLPLAGENAHTNTPKDEVAMAAPVASLAEPLATDKTTLETKTVVKNEKVGILDAAKEVVKGDNTVKDAVKDVLHGRTTTSTVVTAGTVAVAAVASPATSESKVFDFAIGNTQNTTTDTLGAPLMDMGSMASALVAGKNQSSGAELILYQKTGLMDGKFANNPWLLELPDSITKVSWDNYLCVSPVEALEKGWADGDLVTVSVGEASVANVPILLQPGQLSGTYSLALGYGHDMDAQAGRVANGVGVNAYPLVGADTYRRFEVGGVSITKTGSNYPLAKTQTHHHIQIPTGLGKKDRPSSARRKADIVKETSLGTVVAFRQQQHANADAAGAHGQDAHGHGAPAPSKVYGDAGDPPGKFKDLSLYPDWRDTANFYKAIHWGMTVNLNTCTGCNACVIACQAENNIPVVGKDEVMRRRELHWIRIDRYFATPDKKEEDRDLLYTDNPSVMFQPLMCQHCDNAPCENVCPVNAINHSSEGINQQIYNRCMGTRYCANNCPYKVRRFNWFAYFDNEKYNYNFTMNSGLGRMVLNPDVTVRARGVMEKCSFCTQRIQAAKLVAKTENRALKDGDVIVACQQSCPADAIQFGNMNDPHSKVSEVIKGDLSYRLVELLNTDNSVYYTTQVRNVKLESELALWNAPAEESHHGA